MSYLARVVCSRRPQPQQLSERVAKRPIQVVVQRGGKEWAGYSFLIALKAAAATAAAAFERPFVCPA